MIRDRNAATIRAAPAGSAIATPVLVHRPAVRAAICTLVHLVH